MLDDVEDFFIISVLGHFLILHFLLDFLLLLGFTFKVVLCEVAWLAHSIRVVRLISMLTSVGHLGLATVVVALVTHVLCILLLVSMRTSVSLFLLLGDGLQLWLLLHKLILSLSQGGFDLLFGCLLHLDQVEELTKLLGDLRLKAWFRGWCKRSGKLKSRIWLHASQNQMFEDFLETWVLLSGCLVSISQLKHEVEELVTGFWLLGLYLLTFFKLSQKIEELFGFSLLFYIFLLGI